MTHATERIAENRAKWVAALRSGKYTQTKNVLRNGNSFCCMGVLCDLFPEIGYWEDHQFETCFVLRTEPNDPLKMKIKVPPREIEKLVGMRLSDKHKFSHLGSLNDSGATFEAIATIIENAPLPETTDA